MNTSGAGEHWKVGASKEVDLTGGAKTQSTKIGDGRVCFVWGHGLGSTDPALRTRFNDGASEVIFSAMAKSGLGCICYDARGHGASKGWEDSANHDQLQFSWPRLGEDMLEVAASCGDKIVLGGSSMGAASAVYAALQKPEKVKGLVLVRLPTAWEERKLRKPQLEAAAKALQMKYATNGQRHHVLQGSAQSDLPPLSTLHKVLDIPVLILACRGDPTHPVSTAEALRDISTNTHLHISESYAEGKSEWPDLVAEFLKFYSRLC